MNKKNDDLVLIHHGILGQKWGVRRYQNYDGSYTQAGLRRYKQSLENYKTASEKLKSAKQSGDSSDLIKAKREVKTTKRKVNRDYRQLKKDYKADKGKELYRQGHTILGDRIDRRKLQAGVSVLGFGSSAMVRYALQGQDRMKVVGNKILMYNVGGLSSNVIAGGTLAANAVIEGIGRSKESDLRAYYGHSRPKD